MRSSAERDRIGGGKERRALKAFRAWSKRPADRKRTADSCNTIAAARRLTLVVPLFVSRVGACLCAGRLGPTVGFQTTHTAMFARVERAQTITTGRLGRDGRRIVRSGLGSRASIVHSKRGIRE